MCRDWIILLVTTTNKSVSGTKFENSQEKTNLKAFRPHLSGDERQNKGKKIF